jgi:hypothetical protein
MHPESGQKVEENGEEVAIGRAPVDGKLFEVDQFSVTAYSDRRSLHDPVTIVYELKLKMYHESGMISVSSSDNPAIPFHFLCDHRRYFEARGTTGRGWSNAIASDAAEAFV